VCEGDARSKANKCYCLGPCTSGSDGWEPWCTTKDGWAFCAECDSGNGKNSCQGNCGGAARGCHCDSTCVEFGDCCEDFSDYCGCVNQLRLVLKDSGGDGWGDAKLSLQKLYTGAKVSRDFHTLPKGSAKNTTLCIHERTMCYKVVVEGLDGTSRAVKNKQAEIKWSLETLKGQEVASGGYGETAFGVDDYASKGCPTRLFKKIGKYSLKQILKKNDANGDVLNIFKHMIRRADRLGLYEATEEFV